MLSILEEAQHSKKFTNMNMFLNEQEDIDYVNVSFLMTQSIGELRNIDLIEKSKYQMFT
jgi:hypothetical protein